METLPAHVVSHSTNPKRKLRNWMGGRQPLLWSQSCFWLDQVTYPLQTAYSSFLNGDFQRSSQVWPSMSTSSTLSGIMLFFSQKNWLFYWVGSLATIFRWLLEVAGLYTNTVRVSSIRISLLASFWFSLMCCRADGSFWKWETCRCRCNMLSIKPFCFKTAGLSVQSLEEGYMTASVFLFLRGFITSPKGHP